MLHIHRWLTVGLVSAVALLSSVNPVAAQAPATRTVQPGRRI